MIIETGFEIFWFSNFQPLSPVVCCTTILDLPDRTSRIISNFIFGSNYKIYLNAGYWIVNILLITTMTYLAFAKQSKRRYIYLSATAIFSIIIALPVFLLSMIEIIGPRLMDRPYHHCIFCMWQYLPASGLIFLFFILGIFSLLWMFLVELVVHKKNTAPFLSDLQRNLSWTSIFSMTASMGLLFIYHLMLVF